MQSHIVRPAVAPNAATAIGALFRLYRRRMRERRQLAQMTEHDLRGLWLSRSEWRWMINKPFWQE
jgi:uncharacterized protein YjiS (DUF1127 family)